MVDVIDGRVDRMASHEVEGAKHTVIAERECLAYLQPVLPLGCELGLPYLLILLIGHKYIVGILIFLLPILQHPSELGPVRH